MAGDVYVSFEAQVDGLESGFALAKAQTQALQREMQQLAREMVKAGADADAALGQKLSDLGAALSGAKSHMSELSAEMKSHAAAALEAGSALDKFGEFARRGLELAGIGIGAEAFKSLVKSVTDGAEKIERASAKLGASTTEVQQIGAVAKLTGSDFDQMALQLERMQLQLAKSEKASSPARAALHALGIEAQAFRELPIPEQLESLAEAFSRFADGPTKTAAAMALLGRAGAEMIPYLDRGRAGLDELKKAAEDTGVILSDKDVKALAETAEASHKLELASQALGQTIVASLNKAIQASIGLLTRMVEGLNAAISAAQRFGGVSGMIGMLEAGQAGVSLDDGIGIKGVGSIHDRNLGSGFGGAAAKPQVPEMQGLGGGGRKGGDKAAHEEAQAELDAFSEEVKAAQDAAKQKEKALDDALSHHRMSVGEWLKDSVATLNAEAAEVRKVYAEELAVVGLTVAQIAKIHAEKADKLREIGDQIATDQRKAADDVEKSWEAVGKTIDSAIDSQLSAVLNRTESVRTAMAKIAESLVLDFVKVEQAAAMKGITDQLGNTFGDLGGALTSLAANMLKAIGAGAGETAAGVSGFLAPVIGPAAVPAGLAAGAAISAGARGIGSMDIGAYNIPSTQFAMVHKNELVMPAPEAGAFRSMLSAQAAGGSGGGSRGGDLHMHVHAMDSQDVIRALSNNLHPLSKMLAKHWNANPSLRPAY